jgi:dihydropteroate synthase
MLWSFRDYRLTIAERPLVMGIVNVTPDSFSDGGQFFSSDAAIAQCLRFAREGADLLDIGGESSRPGSKPVSLDEELARVIPVIRGVAAQSKLPISIDTTKAEVARQSLEAGAAIINDITAGLGDPKMLEVVAANRAGLILMHMQGTPETMQMNPSYRDVVHEVREFLDVRIRACVSAGISAEQIAVDPGFGFGKTFEHNMLLSRHLDQIASLGRPVVLGVSRKGFLGQITGRPRNERAIASIAMACYCSAHKAAQIWRVHDVAESIDAAKVIGAIASGTI